MRDIVRHLHEDDPCEATLLPHQNGNVGSTFNILSTLGVPLYDLFLL